MERSKNTRRDFLKRGAAGLGAAVVGTGFLTDLQGRPYNPQAGAVRLGPAPDGLLRTAPIPTVRIGFVGTGGMGTAHVQNLVRIAGCQIVAVCDIREAHAQRASRIITEAGHPAPTLYTRGDLDYERMIGEEDLDLVYTATPWRWHVPVMVAAMENGKHAATEVPAAMTLDDCWKLVEIAEKNAKHCVMMENCNYDRFEMLMLSLVRKGLLGEVLHGECGYLHDLRGIKFSEDGEGLWRREWSKTTDANLYPTHGLGPIAQSMDINRGDAFDYLVSMSGPSRGLQDWAREHYEAGHPKRNEEYVLGDVNVCLIKTKMGKTIYVSHDTNLPRPYSRIKLLQGTKGIMQGHPNRVHIEGISEGHGWDDAEEWYTEHEHPLWRSEFSKSDIGHGGMDFLEDYRLIKALNRGETTDMNVYDAASISAVVDMTRISNKNGSLPVHFPDFTRGQWKDFPQLGLVNP